MIDINRLHDLILNNFYGRRIGKTFERCCSVAGEAEVGKNNLIIFLVDTMIDIDFIIDELRNVFNEHQLEFNRYKRNEIKTGDKTIIFTTFDNYEKRIQCGLSEHTRSEEHTSELQSH